MSEFSWKDIVVAPCETFHLLEGEPLYPQRYKSVMKYHEPGLAPVRSDTEAFHLDVKGLPAYSSRFMDTFGYYDNLAAVRNEEGWFHINLQGIAQYLERYDWCGNFQEKFCPVKEKTTDQYFHINREGKRIYQKKYHYVGDFKDGHAVVCNELGLHTHIDYHGRYLHGNWFTDLDVYHKGFARAQDKNGWFHINNLGKPMYKTRFIQVEPFYNGVARVRTMEGKLITINTTGDSVTQFSSPPASWQELSNDLVGFWRTEIIAAAASLKLFDFVSGTTLMIAKQTNLPLGHLERLLRSLWELGIVDHQKSIWKFTKKGEMLISEDEKFLSSAAIMWSDVNSQSWKNLAGLIRTGNNHYNPIFKASASDEKLKEYHQAIDGYAAKDCDLLLSLVDWKLHNTIIGVERNSKILLEKMLMLYPHLEATLLGEAYTLKYANIRPDVVKRFSLKEQDILKPWALLADAILLPKILPSWPDLEVVDILRNASQALLPGGKIYLFEMVLNKNSPSGSLLDLNMLVETGGKLRFLADWENLFCAAHLSLKENIMVNQELCLFILQS